MLFLQLLMQKLGMVAETIVFNNNNAADFSDAETADYTSDIEFLQKRPSHPRDKLKHII